MVAFCQAPQQPQLSNFKNKVEAYTDAFVNSNLFSGSILVAHKNKILFEKGYGWASRRFQIPNGKEIKYRTGSVTKSLTAICVLQLIEKGKLSLEDPLSKYLPDYKHGERIKIKHLLSHTNGIKRDIKFPEVKTYNLEELVELSRVDSLLYQPGTKMTYSNCGYVLLEYILEKVTGEKYETYLQKNVLQPMQLDEMGIEHPAFPPVNFADGFVVGINNEGILAIGEAPDSRDNYSLAVGSLYATSPSLWKFCRQIGKSDVLSPESWKVALSPFDTPSRGYKWGYGFNIYESNGLKVINHNGRTTGFRGGYFYYPEWDLCIIILGNNSNADRGPIVDAYEKMLCGKDFYQPELLSPIEVDKKELAKYIGEYKTQQFSFKVIQKKDGLFVVSHGDPPTRLTPFAKDAFYADFFDLKLLFKRENGIIIACEWTYLGRPVEGKKL